MLAQRVATGSPSGRKEASLSVHHSAADGYSTSAETYARGRPDYPPEALDWLREIVGLGPGKAVLEVGAGTGKFLPLLIETGAEVIALEPVAAMRNEITSHFTVPIIDGTADQIGLEDNAVDAVVCAQAFHWFATPEAVAEMRRVLKPDGVFGLIWNGRDTSVAWVAAMNAIIDPYQGDAPRHQSGRWRDVFPAKGFTALGELHAGNRHTGSPDEVIVDRTLSISFIAALPDEKRAEVERRLRKLIAETKDLTGRSEISFPYDTLMIAFRKDRD